MMSGVYSGAPGHRRADSSRADAQTTLHRLFEPGYRERYYRMKFGIELSDVDFRKQCVCEGTLSQVHGMLM